MTTEKTYRQTQDGPRADAMTMAGLNLIQQALTIYDAELRLAVCNVRFQQMFDLPDWLVTPGASFDDTIRFLAKRGDYGDVGEIEPFVRGRVDVARAFKPHYMERTRANGRTISVEGSPLPEGGWVTVYTDITRTKRQEALLRARSDELSDQLSGYSEELTASNRQLEATITALEHAQRQLTASEARARLTTEMMPAHIAHVGPDGLYTYSNRRLTSVMPGSKSDILGLTVAEALGPAAYAAIKPRLDQAFAGTASIFEFTHQPSSRRIRAAFTPDGQTGGVYILSMDITEETQTRAALQQTRRREVAAQLTSGMAHDFSNLLTIILGLQSRLARLGLPDPAPELIEATHAAARRGGDLLNRIADMTGEREHTPEPVHLPGFFRDLEPLARSTLPEAVGFAAENTLGDATLMLDPAMLQDSLLNLVLNARDACGGAGRITLTARRVQDTWVDFSVTDTGPGLSDPARERAFEPCFTTKGDDGSGLGLVMVYDMTKLAGGRVTLANTGSGAQVTLRLPLRVAPDPVEAGLILLLEDTAEIRDALRDMLRADGHAVIEASSVPEARELLAGLPEISALLSDIVLEGEETGLDLIRNLPRDGLPVILMTSLPPDDPRHAEARDLAPVLRKPVTSARLRALLSQKDCPR
ncbi:PAS-domain containing protein [Roseovarius sp.]|uniref:PAS-domain containing protein n=1 Tax=Roseovarius sp. TaxID=1486281 RepID=UPI003511BBBA